MSESVCWLSDRIHFQKVLASPMISVSRHDFVSDHDSSFAVRYFLFRSMIIGAAFYLPGVFFPQTRKLLRLVMNLEAVQMATELLRLVIVLTLLGLILQGLFYFLVSLIRSFSSEEKFSMAWFWKSEDQTK
jgi:hypothetical protein